MIEALAPHKVILTGEHAVVYGVPAVATSINLDTRVTVRQAEGKHSSITSKDLDTRWELDEPPPQGFEFMERIIQIIQDHYLDGQLPPIHAEIESDVEPSCGLGSSASTAVALTGGLVRYLDLDLDKEKINSIAYEAEKITHGTPSGIDNTVATFGKPLAYSPQREEKMRLMKDPPTFRLLLLDSKMERSTRKAVQKVRELYDQKQQMVEKIFQKIWKISENVWYALKRGQKWEQIGKWLNENHQHLKRIGVSNTMLDRLVNVARKSGALGSKLTGAGLGGYVIALPPQDKAEIIEQRIQNEIDDVKLVRNSLSGLRTRVLES